jgi:dolichol-phosphate mannosyltransferase
MVEGKAEAPASETPRLPPAAGLELSIIVPTFNELENVEALIELVERVLDGVHWEIIFVDDDSPDATADRLHELGRRDPRVRCLRRIGRRGLSSACIEGMLASPAPFLAVMDADLQHEEALLPKMLDVLRRGETDIVVGSRYTEGGSIGGWDRQRALVSRLATRLSRSVLKADLTDPMSGFFMITREAMARSVRNLSGIGFKILVDLFASAPQPLRFVELPYVFRERTAGESKLDSAVAWEYVMLLLDKSVGHLVPLRFLSFCMVGSLGLAVHFLVLWLCFQIIGVDFVASQMIASLVAMTGNFFLNNVFTYRDMRLRGAALLRGWLSFTAVCGIGALANVGVAGALFHNNLSWIPSALAGVLVGTVWNYAVTRLYTWRSAAAGA